MSDTTAGEGPFAVDGKLTARGRALVEANAGLAGHAARRRAGARPQDFDEHRADAYLGLCLVVPSWDPTRYRFATHAYLMVRRHLWRLRQERSRLKRGGGAVVRGLAGADLAEAAVLDAPPPDEALAEAEDREALRRDVRRAIGRLSPTQRATVEGLMRGESIVAIAAALGVAPPTVAQSRDRAFANLRWMLGRRRP